MRKVLGVLLMLAGAPVWALGAWRFFDGDEVQGALLVEGVWHAIFESISRR